MLKISIIVIFLIFFPVNIYSTESKNINIVIKECVDIVHETHDPDFYMDMSEYYRRFDAFYNPATGLVENNATRNGDINPLFVFKKCMSEKGLPLH